MGAFDALDGLVERLAQATWKEREPIKQELLAAALELPDRTSVIDHLENAKRGIDDLELRWEVDEVIETITPEPEPEPEPGPDAEEADPDAQLTAADLTMVYDDPRGLTLHRSKAGDRWFATQRNPQTGQPQTFELHPTEISQLKLQLQGSPYWRIGAGA